MSAEVVNTSLTGDEAIVTGSSRSSLRPFLKDMVSQGAKFVTRHELPAPHLREFLDEIFAAYDEMDATVQEAIQELITALIRSLGPNHTKLLTLLRTFPPGSESLALRVLTIFTEHGRPSAQLVSLVKSIVQDRNLDARFLIPIIGEMDKADIMRHLPKIISLLDGKPEAKNLVRSVFSSIVTTPPQTFWERAHRKHGLELESRATR
ncbi:hypothetical protein FISHEDRAFT_55788 [Fistulina hepatica ATCC 64428]|uniref:Symplekin C-terminal domain-containing protein n=1 Tax=Fistulina hepatica ATCC 64428 TaxID=1128425 RepID=A0A0D7APE1_9AGAR|nr:hypothetical protein FISHEDRAFT_55788 [Fistulina hepatica ATCC 64428]